MAVVLLLLICCSMLCYHVPSLKFPLQRLESSAWWVTKVDLRWEVLFWLVVKHALSWFVCVALRRVVSVYKHGTVAVIGFFQNGFSYLNSSFCSPVTFRMVRRRRGVFETVLYRELSVVFTDELWSVVSVANGWNTMSCEMSFCFLNYC